MKRNWKKVVRSWRNVVGISGRVALLSLSELLSYRLCSLVKGIFFW